LGHLSLDLGNGAVARAHCVTAWQLAQEADDPRLAAWVRGTQAMIACYTGDAVDAIHYSESGREIAPRKSYFYVRLVAQQARAHARVGDADGVRVAFSTAEDVFDSITEAPSNSIFSFDRPYLPFYAGTSYVWLREPRAAQQYAEQAVSLCDASPADWPVARALARVDLALALAQQAEPEHACSVATEALAIYACERPVDLIIRRTGEVVKEVRSHQTLTSVRDFQEQQRELSSQPAAHSMDSYHAPSLGAGSYPSQIPPGDR
jgi:hypothetical protein